MLKKNQNIQPFLNDITPCRFTGSNAEPEIYSGWLLWKEKTNNENSEVVCRSSMSGALNAARRFYKRSVYTEERDKKSIHDEDNEKLFHKIYYPPLKVNNGDKNQYLPVLSVEKANKSDYFYRSRMFIREDDKENLIVDFQMGTETVALPRY